MKYIAKNLKIISFIIILLIPLLYSQETVRARTISGYYSPCPNGTEAAVTTYHGDSSRRAYDWVCAPSGDRSSRINKVHLPASGYVDYAGSTDGTIFGPKGEGIVVLRDTANDICLVMLHLDVNSLAISTGDTLSVGTYVGQWLNSQGHVHIAATEKISNVSCKNAIGSEQPIEFIELGYVPDTLITLNERIWTTSQNPSSGSTGSSSGNLNWNFATSGSDDWSVMRHLSNATKVSDGVKYDISGSDPSLSISGLNFRASQYPYLFIRMESTSDNCIQVFWRRSTDSGLSESRAFVRGGIPTDGNQTEFVIDLRTSRYGQNYNGTIEYLRFDPACTGHDGWVKIKRMSFIPTWSFPSNANGWTARHSMDFQGFYDGGMILDVTGWDPYMYSPSPLMVPGWIFDHVFIHYASEALNGPGCGQIFYRREWDSDFVAGRHVTFSTPDQDIFEDSFLITPTDSSWDSFQKSVRFDPACDTDGGTTDGIRLDRFEFVRGMPTNQNLLRASNFYDSNLIGGASGDWRPWGDITYEAINGIIRYKRDAGGQNSGQISQNIHYAVPENSKFEVQVDLGNESDQPIDFSVRLRDFDGRNSTTCRLRIPANSSLRTYTMHLGSGSGPWRDAKLEFKNLTYEAYVRLDNASLEYNPNLDISGNSNCIIDGPTEFNVPDGDTETLLYAVEMANNTQQPTTVNLAENGTYLLAHLLEILDGTDVTINGTGATIQKVENSTTNRAFDVSGADLDLNQVTMRDFHSNVDGGVIVGRAGSVINVQSSQFYNNQGDDGGAIYVNGTSSNPSTLNVSDSEFSGNSTYDSSFGAIWVRNDSTATIVNSEFIDNQSYKSAGAVGAGGEGASLNIENSTFTGNTANWNGGAVSVFSGATVVIQGSTFNNNSSNVDEGLSSGTLAESDGGAVYANGEGVSLQIIDTTFKGNRGYHGGAVMIFDGDLTADSLIFENNEAHLGGSIYTASADNVSLHNGCIMENTEPKIVNTNTATMDLTQNWWGQPSGATASDVSGSANTSNPLTSIPEFCTSQTSVVEDMNLDGRVTPVDAVYVVNRVQSSDMSADVNDDGVVDSEDVDLVIAAIGTD